MDINKILRVVNHVAVYKHSIFHVYSTEVVDLIFKSKMDHIDIMMRCDSSDVLVGEGYSPAEALFLLDRLYHSKIWANDYNGYSTKYQFIELTSFLNRTNDEYILSEVYSDLHI